MRVDMRLMKQSYETVPPFWREPEGWAFGFDDGEWLQNDYGVGSTSKKQGTLSEVLPPAWEGRVTPHVRWWLEGKAY